MDQDMDQYMGQELDQAAGQATDQATDQAAAGLNEKYLKMTTGSVEKLVCQLAVPTITIMMVSAMYNMADTYFVGSLGTSATAAVGVTFSLMTILQAIGFFFGNGAGNYIARALGAQKRGDAAKMATTGFVSAFLIGCVLAAAGLLALSPLARLLGATDTILPYAREYLFFILLGAPFIVSSFTLNNLLRFQGNSFFGMIGMVSGAVLNIALDPLFIFVFHWGVAGAASATMISQVVSFICLLLGSGKGGSIRISLRDFLPRPDMYKNIAQGGMPSLLRQTLLSLATVLLNRAAGGYSDAVIAAIAIVNRIVMISGAAMLGFGQGFQPVCGFNYGAKQYDRVKRAFRFCVMVSTVFLAVLAVICFIFAPDIIGWFRKDDLEVISVGAFTLRAQCLALPLAGWIISNNMFLQTIGKVVPASVLALSRQGLFLIPLLFGLESAMGLTGIQICVPIADVCTFLLATPLGITALRQMRTG
jgi:putative MATE family efflux protein